MPRVPSGLGRKEGNMVPKCGGSARTEEAHKARTISMN